VFQPSVKPIQIRVLGPFSYSFTQGKARLLGHTREAPESFVDLLIVADHSRKSMQQTKTVFHAEDDSGKVLL
jgi:hypothetical protein